MLTCLRVRSFAIIDELEVELGPGLNVVTGETGAGKSILVAALQLVLGGKGRPEIVRTGAKSAEVEALFDISEDLELRQNLEASGITVEDEMIVRRVILASGRTRAYINGRLATAAQLAQFANQMADISSQHEHHTLADPKGHLDYLDAFGGLLDHREGVADAHRKLAAASTALETLQRQFRERADREDLLRFQVKEIDDLAPVPGEEVDLEDERGRLRHAHHLASAAGGAEEELYARDGALSERLGRIASEVREASGIDTSLGGVAAQLEDALSQIEDAAAALGRYARDVNVDPQRLQEVEDRLDRLHRLQRKYGPQIEDILSHRDSAAAELDGLENHEERVAAAQEEVQWALGEARQVARALSALRKGCAAELGQRISDELASLGMGGARIEVELAPLEARGELEVDGARLSATGIDRAEFLIAPNKGEVARPLRKIASGGELSRAMLAIKRVLAGLGSAGLYVFDEVDTGVGGAVAEVIGRKLKEVAAHHQVLCITHLPQISVFGDTHFHVSKHVNEDRTYSQIRRLKEDERIEELARMVGGVKITELTRQAAAEMLRDARSL